MTEEVKKEESTQETVAPAEEAVAAENPIQQAPQQPPADQPASDIYKVAVLACFGSGARFDAIERMKTVGINLLMTAVQESTTPQGKMAVFNQTVGSLASAAGVQIQQVGDDAKAPETKAETEKAGLND